MTPSFEFLALSMNLLETKSLNLNDRGTARLLGKVLSMNTPTKFDPSQFDRPDRSLLTYYLVMGLFAGPLYPLAVIPMWIRYATLRYKFDEEGISMCWGFLFRREIYLTYKRIQDIHLTRNIVQRWMNLATISVQTASGKSEAEMSIEGFLEAEALRDFLYGKMRGAKNHESTVAPTSMVEAGSSSSISSPQAAVTDRATQALIDIRDAMQKLVDRQQLNNH